VDRQKTLEQAKNLIQKKSYREAWVLLKPIANDPTARKYMQYIKQQIQIAHPATEKPADSPQAETSDTISRSRVTRKTFFTRQISIIAISVLLIIGIVAIGIFISTRNDSPTETVSELPTSANDILTVTAQARIEGYTQIANTRDAEFTATANAQPTNTITPLPTLSATLSNDDVVTPDTFNVIQATQVNASSETSSTINFGEIQTTRINPGDNPAYEFHGEAGQTVLIEINSSILLNFNLSLQSTGTVIEPTPPGQIHTMRSLIFQLPETGIYQLQLQPVYPEQSTTIYVYITQHDSVEDATDDREFIELDSMVHGGYIAQGSFVYRFEATAGDIIRVEVLNTNVSIHSLNLHAPDYVRDGVIPSRISQVNSGYFRMEETALFSLGVSMNFDSPIDTFDLRLTLVSTAQERLEVADEIEHGSNLPDLVGDNGVTSYRYTGNTGDKIRFNLSSDSESMMFYIINDDGLEIQRISPLFPETELILQRDGDYLIEAAGEPGTAFTYSFEVVSGEPIVVDEPMFTTTIDLQDDQNYFADGLVMALRSDGRPIVIEEYFNDLLMYDCTDVYCNYYDVFPIIEAEDVNGLDMKINQDNHPVITYVNRDQEFHMIICNDPICSDSQDTILPTQSLFEDAYPQYDPNFSFGNYLALEFLSDGTPFITSTWRQDKILLFTICTDLICSGVEQSILELPLEETITSVNYIIRSDDTPVVGYTINNLDGIMYIVDCVDVLCTDQTMSQFTLGARGGAEPIVMLNGLDDLPLFVFSTTDLFEPYINVTRCTVHDCTSQETTETPIRSDEDIYLIDVLLADVRPDGSLYIVAEYSLFSNEYQYDLIICEDMLCVDNNVYSIETNNEIYDWRFNDLFFNNDGYLRLFSGQNILFCQTRTCHNLDG